jgi:hypothetical protein
VNDGGMPSLKGLAGAWVRPLRKRRGSGDPPGLQNRRLAPCGVNGAFDSHTLPPIFLDACHPPTATAPMLGLVDRPLLHLDVRARTRYRYTL